MNRPPPNHLSRAASAMVLMLGLSPTLVCAGSPHLPQPWLQEAVIEGRAERYLHLLTFRHNLTDNTELWLQGDVFSDKAQSDVYFSARHYLDRTHWLHASWILSDAYFNDKTALLTAGVLGDHHRREPNNPFPVRGV